MPLYEFKCPAAHRTARAFSMADVPGAIDCPECSIRARRVIGAPHLGRSTTAGYHAMEAASRSAHEPEVVRGTIPGAQTAGRITTNPLHRTLPRD